MASSSRIAEMSGASDSEESIASCSETSKEVKKDIDLTQPWKGSDVTFIVEEKKIYANSAILSIWSPVFKAMFQGGFKEQSLESIPLPGKKVGDILTLFELCHIPMERVNDDTVHTVLPLAEEYQMNKIKIQCEEVLLSQEGSIQNLLIAKQYGFSVLQETCIEFAKQTPISSLTEEELDSLDNETSVSILKFKVERLEPLVPVLKQLRSLMALKKKSCSKCSQRHCVVCEEELPKNSSYPYPGAGSSRQRSSMCPRCTDSRMSSIKNKLMPLDPEKLFD